MICTIKYLSSFEKTKVQSHLFKNNEKVPIMIEIYCRENYVYFIVICSRLSHIKSMVDIFRSWCPCKERVVNTVNKLSLPK